LRRYGRKQGNGGTRTLGFEFQAKTLSRSGKRTALFLDRQIKATRFPQTSGLDVFSHLASTRLASQLPVPTLQSNMQSKSNDPGDPLDAAAN
jgi:hypothetical protein